MGRCFLGRLGLRFAGLEAVEERLVGRPSVHVSALVGSILIVGFQVLVEVDLHFLQALVELDSAFDSEVLVQERLVQPLDDPPLST